MSVWADADHPKAPRSSQQRCIHGVGGRRAGEDQDGRFAVAASDLTDPSYHNPFGLGLKQP